MTAQCGSRIPVKVHATSSQEKLSQTHKDDQCMEHVLLETTAWLGSQKHYASSSTSI